ncbi:hypothetical protein [Nonomuraea polychroma]|uniref:hypothetical protein n=1 Tax=Nonomuraea polychroma TaxID=46176 RepID=UPI000FDE5188|nr:hypothetical protein [Nonomuraea polychroma]
MRTHKLKTLFAGIGAILIAILGTLGAEWVKYGLDFIKSPLDIDSVEVLHDDASGNWAFPKPTIFSQEEITEVRNLEEEDQPEWFRSRGGIDPVTLIINVEFRGNHSRNVRVVDLRAVPYSSGPMCVKPLTGTFVYDPPVEGRRKLKP